MTIHRDGAWRAYWGSRWIPWGYMVLGTVDRGNGDAGAFMLSSEGLYVQGNTGTFRVLPQQRVIAVLRKK